MRKYGNKPEKWLLLYIKLKGENIFVIIYMKPIYKYILYKYLTKEVNKNV